MFNYLFIFLEKGAVRILKKVVSAARGNKSYNKFDYE